MLGNLEGSLEGQCFEDRDPHRIDVASDLVGGGRAKGVRAPCTSGSRAVAHLFAGGDLKVPAQAEVAQIDPIRPPVVQEDVRGLDVAMGDPLLVGAGQGPRGLGQDASSPGDIWLIQVHEAMVHLDISRTGSGRHLTTSRSAVPSTYGIVMK